MKRIRFCLFPILRAYFLTTKKNYISEKFSLGNVKKENNFSNMAEDES